MNEPKNYPKKFDLANYTEQQLFEEIDLRWIFYYLDKPVKGQYARLYWFMQSVGIGRGDIEATPTFKKVLTRYFIGEPNERIEGLWNLTEVRNLGKKSIALLQDLFDTHMPGYTSWLGSDKP